ncbi:putative holin-like toxin [Lacticaseibacillus rhamnosus]|uniref:Holin n=1 Tax=Lacticaseibacillus rhamnosus TaxID=47715 RepID=A0AAP8IYV2_LACRH|nr:putative holin-like toxin [Lacticaseibacillus rhamnosus]MDK7167694.1 putative holin-like toxin [Lacticaseibacillus rhamnosus]MDK7881793.1 putative holin-like toxin [Lacticaseibacillus rhamnosus]PLA55275.1 holin [Lacticaseibacillus rhamnosus]
MSVADALMLIFGDFVLSLIALIITIMLIIQDNKTD